MYCHVAALGHNESALLFALLRALSQGGILPERQRHSVCAEIPASSRHVSSYIVWTVFPLPSPSVMLAVNCSEKSVCDRHLRYLVSCQTSTRWKTSNMALGLHTHTHTQKQPLLAIVQVQAGKQNQTTQKILQGRECSYVRSYKQRRRV